MQHVVLWVSNVERSTKFYCEVLGLEISRGRPGMVFLKIPGNPDDHDLGLFEPPGALPPDERTARMYHFAWEVGELSDLKRARKELIDIGSLVGESNHGTSLSLYAKDPDGLEFEVFWTVPGGVAGRRTALDIDQEMAKRGIKPG